LEDAVLDDLFAGLLVHDVFRRVEDKNGLTALARKYLEPFCQGKTLGVAGEEEVRVGDAPRNGDPRLPVAKVASGIGAEVVRVAHALDNGAELHPFLSRQVRDGVVLGVDRHNVVGDEDLNGRDRRGITDELAVIMSMESIFHVFVGYLF